MNACQITPYQQEQGAATLFFSIIILGLVTYVTFYSSKTVLMEQKISANEYRAEQAFESAEAGLQSLTTFLASATPTQLNQINAVATTGSTITANSGTPLITVPATIPTPTFRFSNMTVGPPLILDATITGTSDDNIAQRSICITISGIDNLPNVPTAPLISRGSALVVGSGTVHNPEGEMTIWSGGEVDLSSSGTIATETVNQTDANYPNCVDYNHATYPCSVVASSRKDSKNMDIIEYDASLANLSQDAFFENFFGVSREVYKATRVTKYFANEAAFDLSNDADLTDEVIWIEGNVASIGNRNIGCTLHGSGATLNTVDTCTSSPQPASIFIVNGDLDLGGGNANFYGLVFVTGSVTAGGNNRVEGTVIAYQNSGSGGSLDIWYSSKVLNQTRGAGGGSNAQATGSWRDFSCP
ncbi:MAG: hypothetical protein HQL49_10745 [Gammaproteobacteria bacterium]|nr:hypothetical protein [Gammaproteobacteria bacterium]